MELKEIAEKMQEVARGAGRLITEAKHPEVFVKEGHANFVTSMDLASQKYIIEGLAGLLPGANFFAEESEQNRLKPGYNWIIDPIDGTTNYMLGYKHSCISIGLVQDGRGVAGVVYNPYLEEMYVGIENQGAFLNGQPIHAANRGMEDAVILFGTATYYQELADLTFAAAKAVFDRCADVRRSGSAALDICYTACGKCDAYFEIRIQPWDYAAASVVAREAGCAVTGLQGGEIRYDNPVGVLTGNPAICGEIYRIVDEQAARLKGERK